MARERRHKSRGRRRRGRFSGLYKLLSALLVTAAVVVACVVFFRVNHVTVAGNSRYTAEEIASASAIEVGDNLIVLPKGQIANRILVGLPYVRGVTVDRVFPDGVLLTVEEHQAAAAVSDGWKHWYISAQGKLLEQSEQEGPLRIEGVTAVEPAAGKALAVAEEEQSRLYYALSLLGELDGRGMLADCSKMDCSVTGQIRLHYLNFVVKMPTTADFSYVLHCLETALDEDGRVSRTDSGTFDFTAADGKFYFSRTVPTE